MMLFFLVVQAMAILAGIFFVGAGFKVWKDHRNPLMPAEIRPSAWTALLSWAIGVYLLLWAF